MQNLHEVFRDLRRKRKSLACRTNCSELFSANRLLHRRSLRLEWLEDRSLLSFVPTGVDLLSISDSGVFDNDYITNLDNSSSQKALQFEVSGTSPSATVGIYADGILIGSVNASSDTTIVTTNGSYDLADGNHLITARQTKPGQGESEDSPALGIVVDTQAPATPVSPDLQAASDSGVSDTDNITNDNAPTIDFIAAPYFRFYRNGIQVGNDYETGTSYTDASRPDGTYDYTVCAVDVAGNVSLASAALSVMIDTEAPAAPTAPDLQATSDTGISDTDNLTNDVTPTFDTVGSPYFRIYRDGVQISGDYESGSYTTSINVDGTYEYTLIAVDAAGNVSALSAPLSVTFDTTAPILDTRQVAKLLADDGESYDYFGNSVSIYGTTAIVGAYGNDDNGSDSGSAYVFEDTGSGWVQVAKLTADDGIKDDYFGMSVSISGATAIIGAPCNYYYHSSYSGSAYIFEDTGSGWTQVAKLTADDGAAGDNFGYSVRPAGDVVINRLRSSHTIHAGAYTLWVSVHTAFLRPARKWSERFCKCW